MKEIPIPFNAQMIQAILAGHKTQTRRVVKPGKFEYESIEHGFGPSVCPYGQPGDRLWVQETFCQFPEGARDGNGAQTYYKASQIDWQMPEVDRVMIGNGVKWRRSIHMPRAASRILLEIVSVRVERLNDCSEADAIAEGIAKTVSGFWSLYGQADVNGTYSPRASYRALWESINGAGSWAANPWVWVIEFKVIKGLAS